jgi:mono/diheme cytochrome c family protein
MKKCVIILVLAMGSFAMQAQTGDGDKGSATRGKLIYEQYCLACHQEDGSGVPGLNPPLIKTKWTLGEKNTLINVVLKGLDVEIEVDGDTYNNVMPALVHLTDAEIADVLTYVRSNFGNKASAIAEADVKKTRAALK